MEASSGGAELSEQEYALTMMCEKICGTFPIDIAHPTLISCYVINYGEKDDIFQNNPTRFNRVSALLHIISRDVQSGNYRRFNNFLTALRKTSNCQFLWQELQQHVQKHRQRVRTSLSTETVQSLQYNFFIDKRSYLTQFLSPDDIIDHLISTRLVGPTVREQVCSFHTIRSEKNRIIVDELSCGEQGTIESFCQILRKTRTMKHIADKLEKEWRELLQSHSSESYDYHPPSSQSGPAVSHTTTRQSSGGVYTQDPSHRRRDSSMSHPSTPGTPGSTYSSQPSTPTQITNMKLMRSYVVDRLTPHWIDVCDYLDYPVSMRNWFGQQHGQVHKKCLIAVLEDWISTDNGRSPKTWQTFITAVCEIDGLEDIARAIRLCLEKEGVLERERPTHYQSTPRVPYSEVFPDNNHQSAPPKLPGLQYDSNSPYYSPQLAERSLPATFSTPPPKPRGRYPTTSGVPAADMADQTGAISPGLNVTPQHTLYKVHCSLPNYNQQSSIDLLLDRRRTSSDVPQSTRLMNNYGCSQLETKPETVQEGQPLERYLYRKFTELDGSQTKHQQQQYSVCDTRAGHQPPPQHLRQYDTWHGPHPQDQQIVQSSQQGPPRPPPPRPPPPQQQKQHQLYEGQYGRQQNLPQAQDLNTAAVPGLPSSQAQANVQSRQQPHPSMYQPTTAHQILQQPQVATTPQFPVISVIQVDQQIHIHQQKLLELQQLQQQMLLRQQYEQLLQVQQQVQLESRKLQQVLTFRRQLQQPPQTEQQWKPNLQSQHLQTQQPGEPPQQHGYHQKQSDNRQTVGDQPEQQFSHQATGNDVHQSHQRLPPAPNQPVNLTQPNDHQITMHGAQQGTTHDREQDTMYEAQQGTSQWGTTYVAQHTSTTTTQSQFPPQEQASRPGQSSQHKSTSEAHYIEDVQTQMEHRLTIQEHQTTTEPNVDGRIPPPHQPTDDTQQKHIQSPMVSSHEELTQTDTLKGKLKVLKAKQQVADQLHKLQEQAANQLSLTEALQAKAEQLTEVSFSQEESQGDSQQGDFMQSPVSCQQDKEWMYSQQRNNATYLEHNVESLVTCEPVSDSNDVTGYHGDNVSGYHSDDVTDHNSVGNVGMEGEMVTDGVKKIKKDGQNERNNSVTTAVTTAATTTTTNTSTRMSDIDAATAIKAVFPEMILTRKTVIEALPLLKTLNLSRCNITDKGADMIALIITKTISLIKLDISHTRLNATNIIKINKALKTMSTLQFLNINNNFISDGCIESIKAIIVSCPTLQNLNLSDNLLTFTGVISIAQTSRDHPNLQVLLLNNNSVSYLSVCEFLVDVILSTNKSLVNVNVCGRNIRPRFIADHLLPPCVQETHTGFVLQNLYLSYYLLLSCISVPLDNENKEAKFMPDNFIKVTEKCPFDSDNITSYFVDHGGGVFYKKEHNFSFFIPPGAISQGDCVQIQVTASRFGPYELPDGYFPISSYFWISAMYTFKIPVYLILSHHTSLRNVTNFNRLYALEACSQHTKVGKEGLLRMNQLLDGVFFDNEIGYCIVSTNHFCSYCLAKDDITIPDDFYVSFYTYNFQTTLKAEICICHVNKECIEVVEEQYHKKGAQLMENPKVFSFNCEQALTVRIDPAVVPGWDVTIPFKEITHKEFDFHKYRDRKATLEKLEETCAFPPRFVANYKKTKSDASLSSRIVLCNKATETMFQVDYNNSVDTKIGKATRTANLPVTVPGTSGNSDTEHLSHICHIKPDLALLTRFKVQLHEDWLSIGLVLGISVYALNEIDLDYQRRQDKCLFMLKKWLEIDCSACYCKLISAVINENNQSLAKEIKETIETKSGHLSMSNHVKKPTNTAEKFMDISTIDNKVTMKVAVQIALTLAAQWECVGYCLELREEEMDSIEQSTSGDERSAYMKVMKTWIRSTDGREPKTWRTFLLVLQELDINCDTVVEVLKRLV